MKNFFKKENFNNNKKGFSLIEVLIACAIISLTSLALMSVASKGIELSGRSLKQVQASMLMEEGVEAVKSIRDNDWNSISVLDIDTNYYLFFDTNTNTWSLSSISTGEIDGVFTRTIVFKEVYRDSNDDIVSSGTLDTGIKKVNVTVSWVTPSGVNSKILNFYLANIFN